MEISYLHDLYTQSSGVSTDTRKVGAGSLFFALKGDHFDGNLFAAEALEKGASYVVVDADVPGDDERYIQVDDVLNTLQDLARYHRKTFSFPVIGLTGSNGKTTTKELTAAVLSRKYRVYATRGNLNNHIGVPLTILSINPALYDMAVIEMGANHQGEIALLCSIAQPTHGLITNIGRAHLEGFGGTEGVVKGKGELFDFLSRKKGVVFVNAESEKLMEMVSKRRVFGEIVFYRSEQAKPRIFLEEATPWVKYTSEGGELITTHLTGAYNFDNICAALTIGYYFNVPTEEADRSVADYLPDNNRSQVIQRGSNTVILDAYNANPSSMEAALANFISLKADRKIVILGDMLELGAEEEAEHLALGKLVAEGGFDVVLLSGKLMKSALSVLPSAYYFPDKFSLHNWIMDHPQENTHFLIKGSRGIGLETVVQFI